MVWYKRIKDGKEGLETHIEQINEMITKFNLDANLFKNKFPNKEVTSKQPRLTLYRASRVPW